jgi:hypothetical protein
MPTSTLTLDHLRDPAPPAPGPAARAAVATRARQLTRRRRAAWVGGSLAVVAVLGAGAGAIAATSSSSAPVDHGVVTPASRVDVFGQFVDVPDGATATVTLTLLTDGVTTYTATMNDDGTFSFAHVPNGTYRVEWEWDIPDGTATQVGRLPNPVTITDGHEVRLDNLKL